MLETAEPHRRHVAIRLSDARLERLHAAADTISAAMDAMHERGLTPVMQVLQGEPAFLEDRHYPEGDVYDERTGSQYYYHAHRRTDPENGHFHVFMRGAAIPIRMQPELPEYGTDRPRGADSIAHLVAISIGHDGLPEKLFTTNQWVTGETLYPAKATARLLDAFDMSSDTSMPETSRWITALVALFRPQIVELLRARDLRIAQWIFDHPGDDVFNAPELDILSAIPINIDAQIAWIDTEWTRRLGRHPKRK